MPDTYEHPALGVRLRPLEQVQIAEDRYLHPKFGLALLQRPRPGASDEAELVLRVSLVRNAPPDVEQAAQRRRQELAAVALQEAEVDVGGVRGIALFPVPGLSENTCIYVAANGHQYEITYGRAMLDADGRALLAGLQFVPPRQAPESLGLPDADRMARRPQQAGWESPDGVAERKSARPMAVQ